MRKASQLRHHLTEFDNDSKLCLNANESTILYNFYRDISFSIEKANRWVAFRVDSERRGNDEITCKWHLIPMDQMGSTYFGETDGVNETMCGIVEARVHGSDGAKVISVTHTSKPPYRLENRSNSHTLLFVQDDDDAVVFELPPMHRYVPR